MWSILYLLDAQPFLATGELPIIGNGGSIHAIICNDDRVAPWFWSQISLPAICIIPNLLSDIFSILVDHKVETPKTM